MKYKTLNTVNDEAEVTCSGSVFQMQAPATGKARELMEVGWTAGTIRSSEVLLIIGYLQALSLSLSQMVRAGTDL